MQTTDERDRQPPERRWKPSRSFTIAAIFIGAFALLQFAEVVWRHLAPPPARPAPAPREEPEAPYPTVRQDGDYVIVEAAGDRTRIRLEYGDDAGALIRCLEEGIGEALGPPPGEPAATPGTPRPTRREVRDRVHDVTRRCIDEANRVAPPGP